MDVQLSDPKVLAVVGFGLGGHGVCSDPRYVQVPLHAYGPTSIEVWRSAHPVTCGYDDEVQWAEDGELQFGAIEIDETGQGLVAASAEAYTRMYAFMRKRGYRHALRLWNYLDAITEGSGDQERYRQFCIGRAQGMRETGESALPAATCIGSYKGPRRLVVYWLACRLPGLPLENPRQLSAYHYPRQYGPQPPSFARAMQPPRGTDMPLLLSGTASITGHATQHRGDTLGQLDEIFKNIAALRQVALSSSAGAQPAPLDTGHSLLKVYVREQADLASVASALESRVEAAGIPRLILHGEVCRDDLAVEVEGVIASA